MTYCIDVNQALLRNVWVHAKWKCEQTTQHWTLTGMWLTSVKKMAFGLSSFSLEITQQMHAVCDLVSQCHWLWKAHQGALSLFYVICMCASLSARKKSDKTLICFGPDFSALSVLLFQVQGDSGTSRDRLQWRSCCSHWQRVPPAGVWGAVVLSSEMLVR